MSNFRARLFQERTELHQRIEKLEAFIVHENFDRLPDIVRADLREQLKHMRSYFTVVDRRSSRQCNAA
jgi:hypothetical protein